MLPYRRTSFIAVASAAAIALPGCKEGAGPAFANASAQAIRLHADFDAEPYNAVDSLILQPGEVFRDPFKHKALRITVEAHGQVFRLDVAGVTRTKGPVDPWMNLWLFDGTAICLMPVNRIDAKRMPACEDSK